MSQVRILSPRPPSSVDGGMNGSARTVNGYPLFEGADVSEEIGDLCGCEVIDQTLGHER